MLSFTKRKQDKPTPLIYATPDGYQIWWQENIDSLNKKQSKVKTAKQQLNYAIQRDVLVAIHVIMQQVLSAEYQGKKRQVEFDDTKVLAYIFGVVDSVTTHQETDEYQQWNTQKIVFNTLYGEEAEKLLQVAINIQEKPEIMEFINKAGQNYRQIITDNGQKAEMVLGDLLYGVT